MGQAPFVPWTEAPFVVGDAAWADVVEDFIAFQISRCDIVVMEVLEKLIVCNRSRY